MYERFLKMGCCYFGFECVRVMVLFGRVCGFWGVYGELVRVLKGRSLLGWVGVVCGRKGVVCGRKLFGFIVCKLCEVCVECGEDWFKGWRSFGWSVWVLVVKSGWF